MGLLREQQAAHFADVSGAECAFTLPVSDRLVTRLIAPRVPASWPIREVEVRAAAGNQLAVRLRLARASFLPAVTIRLAIEQQPLLPLSPVLVLRIVSEGFAWLAGTTLRFLQVLPQGLRLDGDRLYVDVAALLERYGAAGALHHLTSLELTTTEGRIVVAARATIPREALSQT